MSATNATRPTVLSVLLCAALALACDPSSQPNTTDSQTNWLRTCRIDAQCGDATRCLCGVCTSSCSDDDACDSREGSACVAALDPGTVAQCGGIPPSAGLCLPRCDDSPCANGQMCVAGVCTPVPEPTAVVSIDTRAVRQTLVGFGASVAYSEDEIVSHPQTTALYDVLFADLGLDVLRFRDRYAHAGDDNLDTARTLLDAATASLGHPPTVFMTSWSPPPALKANGSAQCSGNADTCTLVKTPAGAFDYAGFAAYLRASLDAYARIGIVPDYFGIQNNPNWLPTSAELGEACRFLPSEGSVTVPVGGINTTVEYPGFDQAHSATIAAFQGLANAPQMMAPETSEFESVAGYVQALDLSKVDALAHHLYGVDPLSVDTEALARVGELAAASSRPIFQTEMQADGFGTALLIHYTTALEGGSAYLQSALIGSASGPTANTQALVGVSETSFVREGPYYAMQHYARHTDPGWVRVDATSDRSALLASAWQPPGGGALTVILLNSGAMDLDVELDLPATTGPMTVTRTVFGGYEHGVTLGELSPEGILSVPARAIVTVWSSP